MKIPLWSWPGLLLSVLLFGGYLLAARATLNSVPPGTEVKMWPPLHRDLRAIGLDPAKVRVGVHIASGSFSQGIPQEPIRAEYVVDWVKAARLKVPGGWRDQGSPERPKFRWFGGRHNRPQVGVGCAQQLVTLLSPGQRVETADVVWTEGTPPTQLRANLRIWRASATLLPTVARGRICVEASRQLLRP